MSLQRTTLGILHRGQTCACVLYSASLRDLLLTMAALDAFDIRWSEDSLDGSAAVFRSSARPVGG